MRRNAILEGGRHQKQLEDAVAAAVAKTESRVRKAPQYTCKKHKHNARKCKIERAIIIARVVLGCPW